MEQQWLSCVSTPTNAAGMENAPAAYGKEEVSRLNM